MTIPLRKNMTPDEGYALAGFQRPGVKIVTGPLASREELVAPLSAAELRRLPGEWSYEDYCFRRDLGFVPSLWAKVFGEFAARSGHAVTAEEWAWLHGPASLERAGAWLLKTREEVAA